MPWEISGIDEFRDFAEDVEEINVQQAIRRAVEQTAEDYIDIVTGKIRRKSTAKGGTLDSRSSPYSPGTSNDSSDDNLHISEPEAWDYKVAGDGRMVVHPRGEVRDRARFLEAGTSDHGPEGDTPMHFYVGGTHIVVADINRDDTDALNAMLGADGPEERADALFEHGVPGEVEGVNAQNFFSEAAQELRKNRRLVKNLETELEREVAEAME